MIIITSYKGRVAQYQGKGKKLSVKMKLLFRSIALGLMTYTTCPIIVVK
jgi:hypothetical protein